MLLSPTLLALFGGALAGAGTNAKASDQWLCSFSAVGSHRSSVAVQFYVKANGTLDAKGVLWTPPIELKAIHYTALEGLDLSIQYDQASARNIGPSTWVGTSVWTKKPLVLLDGATAVLTVLNGPLAKASFDRMESDTNFRSATFAWSGGGDEAVLSGLDEGDRARLSVLDVQGQELASFEYDVSGRAERDQLFRKAWRIAKAKSKHPRHCDKTRVVTISLPEPTPTIHP